MGNACKSLIRRCFPKHEEEIIQDEEDAEPQPSSALLECIAVVSNNHDGYFGKDDLVTLAKKYPECVEWEEEKKQEEEDLKSNDPKKKKHRKLKWKEGEVIGHGSFGRVIIGLNLKNGELMAVKQVHIGGLQSSVAKERIKELVGEIALLSKLKHKNIVRYIGTTKEKKTTLNICLEFISGGSLSSVIQKYGKLNEKVIRLYTRQILEGLEYLHLRGSIHRDIKGANVLVDNNGICKLADFGSAKQLYSTIEGEVNNFSLKGTANWMAPEVIMQTEVGRASDIWSLGCTLIEMATGKPPFHDAGNQITTMFQIAKGNKPVTLPTDVSPECIDFMKLCLKKNPKERPNVTKLLQHKFVANIEPSGSNPMNESGRLQLDGAFRSTTKKHSRLFESPGRENDRRFSSGRIAPSPTSASMSKQRSQFDNGNTQKMSVDSAVSNSEEPLIHDKFVMPYRIKSKQSKPADSEDSQDSGSEEPESAVLPPKFLSQKSHFAKEKSTFIDSREEFSPTMTRGEREELPTMVKGEPEEPVIVKKIPKYNPNYVKISARGGPAKEEVIIPAMPQTFRESAKQGGAVKIDEIKKWRSDLEASLASSSKAKSKRQELFEMTKEMGNSNQGSRRGSEKDVQESRRHPPPIKNNFGFNEGIKEEETTLKNVEGDQVQSFWMGARDPMDVSHSLNRTVSVTNLNDSAENLNSKRVHEPSKEPDIKIEDDFEEQDQEQEESERAQDRPEEQEEEPDANDDDEEEEEEEEEEEDNNKLGVPEEEKKEGILDALQASMKTFTSLHSEDRIIDNNTPVKAQSIQSFKFHVNNEPFIHDLEVEEIKDEEDGYSLREHEVIS